MERCHARDGGGRAPARRSRPASCAGHGMIAAFGAPDRARGRRAARRARRPGAAGAAGRDRHGARERSRHRARRSRRRHRRHGADRGLVRGPAGSRSGDVVEAAARLARDAAPGEILDRRSHPGVARRCCAHRPRDVRALRAARAGRAPRGRAAPTPRSSAVSVSCGCWTRPSSARRRRAQPQLVTVIGEPGIGKSRLARELTARLGGRATVLEGRCLPYGLGITYWPVREMVLQAAGGRPLETLTAGLADGAAAAASVAGTLGLGESAPGEATPWGFRRLFGAVARDGPLVLLFEDVHWAEPPLLDLVDDLAATPDRRAGAAALPRPPRAARRPPGVGLGAAGVTAVRLGPLSADESRPATGRPQRPLGVTADGGRGASRRQPALPRAAGRARGRARRATAVLPPALHALLAARLDLLAPQERSLLDAAAIEGERFHLGGVLALVEDLQEVDASRSLDTLVDRELLLPARAEIAGEHAWRFRHALVRDTAYASMPKAARAQGHERLANWLELIETRVPEADAWIGTHLERAHGAAVELGRATPELEALAARAAQRLAEAGSRAHRRGDLPSEIAFLSRAAAAAGRRRPGARRAAAGARRGAVRGRLAGPGGGGRRRRRSRSASASASHVSAGEPPSSASACTPSASRDGGPGRVAGRHPPRGGRAGRARRRSRARPRATTLGCELSGSRAARRWATATPSACCTTRGAPAAASRSRRPSATWRGRSSSTRSRCPEAIRACAAARARGHRALRRVERARVQGRARRDGRALRARTRRARDGARRASPSWASSRPRSGWPYSTRWPRCWRATPPPPSGRSRTRSGSRSRSATAGSSRRSSSTARTRSSRRTDRARPPRPSRASTTSQRPVTWSGGSSATPRAGSSRRCDGDAGPRAARGTNGHRARRRDRDVHLPRRRAPRPRRGRRPLRPARGGARRHGHRARAVRGQGERRLRGAAASAHRRRLGRVGAHEVASTADASRELRARAPK